MLHCEHKFKRAVDQIYKCKLCSKVVYRSKKKTPLTKEADGKRSYLVND